MLCYVVLCVFMLVSNASIKHLTVVPQVGSIQLLHSIVLLCV